MNKSNAPMKFVKRTLCILSIGCLTYCSAYDVLTDWPFFAGFLAYVSLMISVQLTSTFWGSFLLQFRGFIAFMQLLSVVVAGFICFSGFLDDLWYGGPTGPDIPTPTQLDELTGSIQGFTALIILFLVTSIIVYVRIKLVARRSGT
jgi:hypothetical protein